MLGNLARRLDEGVHCNAGQRTPDAHARTPMAAMSLTVKPSGHALRILTGLDAAAFTISTICSRSDARHVKALCPRIAIRLEPLDRFGEIVPAVQEAFVRPVNDVAAGLIDRPPRGLHPLDREIERVDRVRLVIGEVLDRNAGDAGLDQR